MAKYIINNINGEYVDVTVFIQDKQFDQSLCGMPTDDKEALTQKLEDYVADYEEKLTTPQEKVDDIPVAVKEMVGKEIIVGIDGTYKPVKEEIVAEDVALEEK